VLIVGGRYVVRRGGTAITGRGLRSGDAVAIELI